MSGPRSAQAVSDQGETAGKCRFNDDCPDAIAPQSSDGSMPSTNTVEQKFGTSTSSRYQPPSVEDADDEYRNAQHLRGEWPAELEFGASLFDHFKVPLDEASGMGTQPDGTVFPKSHPGRDAFKSKTTQASGGRQATDSPSSWWSYMPSRKTVVKSILTVNATAALGAACYYGYGYATSAATEQAQIAADSAAASGWSSLFPSKISNADTSLSNVHGTSDDLLSQAYSGIRSGLGWASGQASSKASSLWASVGGAEGLWSGSKWALGKGLDGVSGVVQMFHDIGSPRYAPQTWYDSSGYRPAAQMGRRS